MKLLLIVTGLILAAIAFYVLRTKAKASELQPGTDIRRPSPSILPVPTKQNDKLVLVKSVSYSDLKRVLTGFCNMYNNDSYQAQPRLTKVSEQEFAITFPYDIDFEIFCYFVNYLEYPMDLTWSPDVTAWATVKRGDKWITGKSASKKAILFIPPDDTEHDNVYMTTQGNVGYKLGFAVGEKNHLPATPKKPYTSPEIEISELNNKEFENFK